MIVCGNKTCVRFLRTGDLAAAQRIALADLRREGLPEGGERTLGETLEFRLGRDDHPGRYETLEFDLLDDTDHGVPLAGKAASDDTSSADGGVGGGGPSISGGSDGDDQVPAGTDKPEFGNDEGGGGPEESQAQDEPGVGDGDEGPEGAVTGADGTDETENILANLYGQHGVDDETAATLAKTGVEPQIDPELHEDRAALIRAIRDVDLKDGKAIQELRGRIAKVMSGDMSGMTVFQDQLGRRVDGQDRQETVEALAPHAVKRFGREIDPENAKLLAAVMDATPGNQQDVRRAVNKRFGVMSGGGVAYQATLTEVIQHRESGGTEPSKRLRRVFRHPLTQVMEFSDLVLGLGMPGFLQGQPFLVGGLIIATVISGHAGGEVGPGGHCSRRQDQHNDKE